VVYGLLWSWVVAVVGLVTVASGQDPVVAERAVMEVVTGDGDMSTDTFRLSRGLHRIRWDAPCVLEVELWRNVGGRDVFLLPLGRRSSKEVIVPIGRDGKHYFLSVGADCAWTIGIS
jgi:hypothetical protein